MHHIFLRPVGSVLGRGPVSGIATGYAVLDSATTQVTLTSLDGFEAANSAIRIGFISDAACYVVFGDGTVNVDTANDPFVPANTFAYLTPDGRFFGMRSVSGTANVRIWPIGTLSRP